MRHLDINRLLHRVARTHFREIEKGGSYDFTMQGFFVEKLPYGDTTTLMTCSYVGPRPSFKDYDEMFEVYALDILSPRTMRNFRALIGGLSHELAHLVAFREGIRKPHDERAIDQTVIERGLCQYLLAMKSRLCEWDPDFRFTGYTPEEVSGRLS